MSAAILRYSLHVCLGNCGHRRGTLTLASAGRRLTVGAAGIGSAGPVRGLFVRNRSD